jgi:hypothetical protein
MKKVIAIAASLLVNLSVVAALERSADEVAPQGEVFITDLNAATEVTLAQATVSEDAGTRAVAL